MDDFFTHFHDLLSSATPFVAVTLVEAVGSTPADAGSKILVTADGLLHGTVGGGRIEARAIDEAKSLLADPAQPRTRFVAWNLQTDIKMTCGGAVKLFFERFLPQPWPIVIFGAGHVSQALSRTLLNLDCHLTLFDQRQDWLDKLPRSPKLTTHHTPDLPREVAALPQDAFVVLMTQGHSVDAPILIELLRCPPFPYIGVIGSAAKRAALRKNVLAAGIEPTRFDAVHCPMGLDLGSNHPYEIALSIAAQLIQVRDIARVSQDQQAKIEKQEEQPTP